MKKVFSILVLSFVLLFTGCIFQHGTSKDYVMGYDRGIFWEHAYLVNDHNTCYCFDNQNFESILKDAQENNKKVIITYETYLFRGTLCSCSENYEEVVVINIQYAKE